MAKERRIIYTDASSVEKAYKISIYDKGNNATHIIDLKNSPNIQEAESQAVLYAILYIVENDLKNAHILCDNKQAAENQTIQDIAKKAGCAISWIPREINTVADKVSRLESTKKEDVANRLNFLYMVLFNKEIKKVEVEEQTEKK